MARMVIIRNSSGGVNTLRSGIKAMIDSTRLSETGLNIELASSAGVRPGWLTLGRVSRITCQVCLVGVACFTQALIADESVTERSTGRSNATITEAAPLNADELWQSLMTVEDASLEQIRAEWSVSEWRSQQTRALVTQRFASWREGAVAELTANRVEKCLHSAERYRTWLGEEHRRAASRCADEYDRSWELAWLAASAANGRCAPASLSRDERFRWLKNLLQISETRGSSTACEVAHIECNQRERLVAKFESMPPGTANSHEIERARLELAVSRAELARVGAVRKHHQLETDRLRQQLERLSVSPLEDEASVRTEQGSKAGDGEATIASLSHGEGERCSVAVVAKYRRKRLDAIAALYTQGHASRLEYEVAERERELSDLAVARLATRSQSQLSITDDVALDDAETALIAPLDEDAWRDGGTVRRAIATRRTQFEIVAQLHGLREEIAFLNEVAQRLETAGATRELELHRLSLEFLSASQISLHERLRLLRANAIDGGQVGDAIPRDKLTRARLMSATKSPIAEIPIRHLNEQVQRALQQSQSLQQLKVQGHASLLEVERGAVDVSLAQIRVREAYEQQAIARCDLELLKLTLGP